MTALGIRYLCGRTVAADPASYDEPEWPPHPARIFMALAAAHFETRDEPPTAEDERERRALEWLERQPPPSLRVSGASVRDAVTAFVPVNDTEISSRADPTRVKAAAAARALGVLPEHRSRQPRTFPSVVPEDEVVWMIWAGSPPADVREALDHLGGKVTRIGHSSSLVQMWLADGDAVPPPSLVPHPAATTHRLRVPAEGFLSDLEARHNAGLRPAASLWEEYGAPEDHKGPPGSVFDPRLLVVRLVPGDDCARQRLGLASTATVVDRFRRAVLSAADEPVPEFISGHRPGGGPSERDHIALLPLGFVGHRHADGHLLGLAVALPRELSPESRRAVTHALHRLVSPPGDGEDPGRLVMGSLGRWRLEPVAADAPPYALRTETWTAPSAVWASITPVVLDRFTNDEQRKREIVADACVRVGLPRPTDVRLSHVSPFPGVPSAPAFGPLPSSRGRPTRPYTHALLVFRDASGAPRPVQGPVLIGAGRFRGYGVFRPLDARGVRRG